MKIFFMMKFLLLCILISYVCCQEPCNLDLEDISTAPIFRPLIYDTNGKLLDAKGGKIKLQHGKKVKFSCQENFFRTYPNQLHEVDVECKDDALSVNGEFVKKFKELSCDIRVIEEVKHAIDGCTGDSKGIYYQYLDDKKKKHIKLAEVCYNYKNEQIDFVRTVLDRNIDNNPKVQHNEALQSNTDVNHRMNLLAAYRADRVTPRLKNLLGDESMFINEFLLHVKLLPKSLFNLQLQDFEKFPTNIVGMWKSIFDGNWRKVIDSIKSFADNRDQPLDLLMGTSGVVTLPNEDTGHPTKLNLHEGKVPIPSHVWTIVSDPSKDQAVAIVTINNPFLNPTELKQQTFCESQCGEIPWLKRLTKNENNERIKFGYTFCCKVRDFKFFPSMKVGGGLLKV